MAGEILAEIREFVKRHQYDAVMALSMVLIAWSFFNIGRLTTVRSEAVTVTRTDVPAERSATVSRVSDPRVVVSKNSDSMKYHYSWCSGAQRIKEENRVWFETAQAAETAGYTLAGNCQ